ncbi:hypothetical protein, conserved in T. vivax, partial [Trypanosoma vivax Y486]
MAGTACFLPFLLFRVWCRFSARGAFARMELTRGAWLLALVLLAAATGEAAIDSKAGVTEADAGLLCVVSGALKGGARQAQVDTARAFTLMTAIAAHRAGPDVAKGAQPALAKMSARTKQEAVAASQRATHALASLERQKARAAALAQAIATSAAEAATLSAHIAGEMDQWTRIASTLVSKATNGYPCITTSPSSNAGTITLSRNLAAATEAQSGGGTAYGKPVPAACDADPTAEMQATKWSHVTSAIATAKGRERHPEKVHDRLADVRHTGQLPADKRRRSKLSRLIQRLAHGGRVQRHVQHQPHRHAVQQEYRKSRRAGQAAEHTDTGTGRRRRGSGPGRHMPR